MACSPGSVMNNLLDLSNSTSSKTDKLLTAVVGSNSESIKVPLGVNSSTLDFP